MAVYRMRRRRLAPALLLGALLLLALALGALVGLLPLLRGPSPAGTLKRMEEILEVLEISHYTPEVVEDGVVLRPGEYEASLEDLRLLQQVWLPVQDRFPPEKARRVETALDRLTVLIQGKADPQEVRQAVQALRSALHSLEE